MTTRVLLADDHPDLRFLLRRALERDGRFLVVAEAGNGAEAIQRASQTLPDLVVLDLSMPIMDGLEALPRIKRESPASRVVVLSGFEREVASDLVVALGANAYLEKGLHPWALADHLARVSLEEPRAPSLTAQQHDALVERVRALV